MAGRDPTGALLGWMWYFLARYLNIFNKLREIVLAQFGASTSSVIDDFAQLRRCEYLQWVIHETVRIVAVIPMNERVALKDTTLPRGGGEDGSKPIFVREGI
jgi:cytochrome P450